MRRPVRQFRTQLSELEGRLLLSRAPALAPLSHGSWSKTMHFVNSAGVELNVVVPTQVATQLVAPCNRPSRLDSARLRDRVDH